MRTDMSVEEVQTLMRRLAQPQMENAPLETINLVWEIPNPTYTQYKNIYYGGEENEKREVLYKHLDLDGPEWLGKLKLDSLSWHYFVVGKSGEFLVDQMRATIISTRPNRIALGKESQSANSVHVPVSLDLPEQSWSPICIPLGGSSDGEVIEIPLRDIAVKSTPSALVTTYTFTLAFEYARRLRRTRDPDCFDALFHQSKFRCQIGFRAFSPLQQVRPVVGRACRHLQLPDASIGVDGLRHHFKLADPAKYRIIGRDGAIWFIDKSALANTSPVFQACFQHSETAEEQSQSYPIDLYPPDAVESFLLFCLTGHCPDADLHAMDVVHLAHHFQVPLLLAQMEMFLIGHLLQDMSMEKMISLGKLACRLDLKWLLLALHWVVEERAKFWTKDDRLKWNQCITDSTALFFQQTALTLAELAE